MKKSWLVFKYELITILRSRSFQVALVIVPLGGLLVILVGGLIQRNQKAAEIASFIMPEQEILVHGIIDQSGLVESIPPAYSALLISMPDVTAARAAVEQGEIDAFFVIPSNYMEEGQVLYYRQDYNPVGASSQTYLISSILQENLLKDKPELLQRLQIPFELEVITLSSEPQRDPTSMLTFFLPYGVTLLFYIVILGSASLMLSSITTEKQNRMTEILLTSITPTEMLLGKICALGLAGLSQTVVYFVSGFFLLRLGGNTFNLSQAFQLPPSILVWGVIFFLLGYAIYASMMAGIGALVPSLREASQATTVIMIPLIIPLMFVTTLIQSPNGTLAILFSFFPLSAPVSMMTRLAATQVPFWQPLTSALLQALTAWLIVRASAKMFRAQNLLTGQKFSLPEFIRAMGRRG